MTNIEKNEFWVILWAGDGRPARKLKQFNSFRDAHNFCLLHEWVYVDKNGIKWNMDIEEARAADLDDVINSCEKIAENQESKSEKGSIDKDIDR